MISIGTIDRPWLYAVAGSPARAPGMGHVGVALPPIPQPRILTPLLKTGSAAVITPLGLGVLAVMAVGAFALITRH